MPAGPGVHTAQSQGRLSPTPFKWDSHIIQTCSTLWEAAISDVKCSYLSNLYPMRFSGQAVISSVRQILAVLREGDGHFIQKCRGHKLEEKAKGLRGKQCMSDDGMGGWGSYL